MKEMTPEQVSAKVLLDRKTVADNAKQAEIEYQRRRMLASREIENRKIENDNI